MVLQEKIEYVKLLSKLNVDVSRVRGFSITILDLLRETPMMCPDIAEITGKSRQYVQKYLYSLQKYGLIDREGCFWHITDEGLAFLEYRSEIDLLEFSKERREETNDTHGY